MDHCDPVRCPSPLTKVQQVYFTFVPIGVSTDCSPNCANPFLLPYRPLLRAMVDS